MGLAVAFLFGNKPIENDRGAVLEQHAEEATGVVSGL